MTKSRHKNPPRLAEWILRCIYPDRGAFTSLGDFREEYIDIYLSSGSFKANLWYWIQIAKSIPGFIKNKSHWYIVMIHNYLKIHLRNMRRFKTYSFINITGLSIGISCFLAIFLYVRFEMSYDNYHPDVDRIYRVAASVSNHDRPGEENSFANISAPAAPAIKENFLQVENAARFEIYRSVLIQHKQKVFYESNFLSADPEIFKMFNIPVSLGAADDLITRPGTVTITEEIAEKYFGSEDPRGKIINIDRMDFEVTAVIKNPPRNSHIKYNFIAFLDLNQKSKYKREGWDLTIYYTYIKVEMNTDILSLENSINALLKSQPGQLQNNWTYFLQPVRNIHLHSSLLYEVEPPGNPFYLYVFSVIGILILSIASINFVNLTTARSFSRAREVGLRKVIGAQKGQLIRQFLGESLLISLFATAIAICLILLLLPFLSDLTGMDLKIIDLLNPGTIPVLLALACIIGLGSGIYPAFVLSGFSPLMILKGLSRLGLGKTGLRKYLVVSQFAVSVFLIISTLIVYFQLDFMKNANLGFEKEKKLCITANLTDYNYESIKNEFFQHNKVRGVTASSAIPGRGIYGRHARPKGKESSLTVFDTLTVDYDFLSEYKLEIIAGQDFKKGRLGSTSNVCIINETGVKVLGFDSPENALEKEVETENSECIWNNRKIIGVVKNFHCRGLQHKIDPLMLILPETQDSYLGVLTLSVDSHNLPETLEFAEKKWKELHLGPIFNYRFLDEDFNRFYRTEEMGGRILTTFTALGLIIAFLGLFGLVSFTAEQRTKEIGIRKILGATTSSIFILLTKKFVKLVVLGILIAFPIAYYAMDQWLRNFAYRIDVGWLPFIGAAVTAVILSLLTVCYQSVKAATINPVDSLRYE